MTIRPLEPGEGAAAAALAAISTTAAQWPAAEYERVAEGRARGQFCLVAEDDAEAGAQSDGGELAGLIVISAVAGEAELLNFAVAPPQRRKGVGAALLAEGIGHAAAAGARRVWLEVRASNQVAINFYLRNGFRVSGRRPAYYANPLEDAILLARDLSPP